MHKFTLPPSPNWQFSNVLASNDDGLLAYGSRSEITIINFKSGGKFDVTSLSIAHKDKVNCVVFSPVKGNFKNCLATCGDDGMVRVWDFQESRLLYCHSGHKDGVRVMGLDWSRADTNRLVSVNDLGSVICWDLASNTIRKLHCGAKVLPLCLSCCPHDKDMIAIGCKNGISLVVDIKGNGKLVHRLRGHEQDVISVSWCPVPHNVLKHNPKNDDTKAGDMTLSPKAEKERRDLLLATGGCDKSIFIWRTGSDGRYEVVLNLPSNTIGNNFPRKKGYLATSSNFLWIVVHWVDAYTLLSTSQFGELLAWDLSKVNSIEKSKKPQARLLHNRHHKGCFSIACPVIYDVISEGTTHERTVWTTAMDKHVIASSLTSGNVLLDIPTVGGAVYCMAVSPLDPNRLAIGSSDSKVFIWNMSDVDSLDITTYWRKIIGKVMALCWHPTEENWLAYGTSDGHVGLLDVGSNKVPTQFRLHHRKAVYRLCWAPPIIKTENAGDNKLALFSVGDGDVFQYTANLQEPNEEPKSLNAAVLNSVDEALGLQKHLTRSEVIFKPDLSCLAVGSENGSVYILNCQTMRQQHVIYPHKKLMNNLEWHPETVASDNSVSHYKDWLATSCDNIKVYNISAESQPDLIATLSGHTEKIVGLAWSPHFNGRLLSAAYDYSVQVWDVPSQACIGVCLAHSMAVMCAMFSPLDPDYVISGSADNTLRLWSISQLTSPNSRPDKKKDRLGNKLKERQEAQEATELTVGMSDISDEYEASFKKHNKISSANSSLNSNQSSPPTTQSDKGTEDYKKRQKSRAVFTVTGPSLTQARHFDVMYQRWLASSTTDLPPTPPIAGEDKTPSVSELGYLDFFGDDKAMQRLLMVEESRLVKNNHYQLAQQSALWRGDVSQMVKEAITRKRLTDWLVSMAPITGYDIWEEACVAYADQLAECGEVVKASSYLLAVHRAQEAVRLLADYKQYREAIAVARCRLSPNDPLVTEVYLEWGLAARQQGCLALAAHCYLAANDTQACIETLARVKELKSLKMAAKLAKQVGQVEMADSLAVECLTMSIVASNFTVGYQMIKEMSQYEHWSVWLRASELLAKVKNRSEVDVFDWLEGRKPGYLSLFDELTTACSNISQTYEKLLPYLPSNKTPEFERDMWFYVSGHLTAACAIKVEDKPVLFLRHIVLALSAAFHFQTSQPRSLALPLIISVLTPTGLFAKESVLMVECNSSEEKQLMKSLKAFVCASIIHWMTNNWEKVTKLQTEGATPVENGSGDSGEIKDYKMNWLPEILMKCSGEVLDPDNVAFFVKKAHKQELQNIMNKENIQKKSVEKKNNGESGWKKKSNGKTDSVNGQEKKQLEKSVDAETVIKQTETKQVNETFSTFRDPVKTLTKCANKVDENLNVTKETKDISHLDEEKSVDSTDKIDLNKTSQVVSSESKTEVKEVKNDNLPNIPAKNVIDKEITTDRNGKVPIVSTNESSTKFKTEANGDCHSYNDDKKLISCETSISCGTSNKDKNNIDYTSKVKEIKELDEVLQKFESERVSVPSPFTAYMNIKYLLDNLVSVQDTKLAHVLQADCDLIWKTSKH